MITIIVSYYNAEKWKNYLEPSLGRVQRMLEEHKLPALDIHLVKGTESIFTNYNIGRETALYPIRAFIHEDVDLGDPSWLFKVLNTFAGHPDTALVGFTGTVNMPKVGNWWDSGREYIRGELFSGYEKADWVFKKVEGSEQVQCVDGFFMAMNRDIAWSDLKGFHCYDLDMARRVKKLRYQIRVVGHKTHHIGEIRPRDGVDELFKAYYEKWKILDRFTCPRHGESSLTHHPIDHKWYCMIKGCDWKSEVI